MARRPGGGAAFLVAAVDGAVPEVAVSGDTVSWIHRSGRRGQHRDREAGAMSIPRAAQDAGAPERVARPAAPSPSHRTVGAQRRRPRPHALLPVARIRDRVQRRHGLLPARRHGTGARVQGRHRHGRRAPALAPARVPRRDGRGGVADRACSPPSSPTRCSGCSACAEARRPLVSRRRRPGASSGARPSAARTTGAPGRRYGGPGAPDAEARVRLRPRRAAC